MRRVGRRRLPRPQLLFHPNVDGDLHADLDAFALGVPWGMRAKWHGADDFPGPQPVDDFLAYIGARVTPTAVYWSAYPAGTVSMIRAAIELDRRHERFVQAVAGADDERFAEEYGRFLDDVQGLL
ncbi:MAG: hypothetical protein NVS1B9_02800 [Solirubrobacteraceae bacterium]